MSGLIVGGPHDGHWYDADRHCQRIELPVRTAVIVDPILDGNIPVPSDRAVYTRRYWRAGGPGPSHKVWFIWAPPAMSDVEVMDQLLRGYRPERWDEL